jgi:ActR/RegA family two-component response regulator
MKEPSINNVRLNGLLVSGDSYIRQSVAETFAGIDLRISKDSTSALQLINCTHFDGLIIDCDDMESGMEIIVAARCSRTNRKSVVFSFVNEKMSIATAMELGSNFALRKPLDCEHLSTYFQSSLEQMHAEHRRYFRFELTLDAKVVLHDGSIIPAQILNISNGGVALRLLNQAHLRGPVIIQFALPNARKTVITAVAAPCWSHGTIVGMKFNSMDDDARHQCSDWLSNMTLS